MSKEFLRNLPLFADMPEEDMDRLYEMAENIALRPGQVLMREGEIGDAVYVVLDGTFEVTKLTGGQEVAISGCKPGDVIGEISLLDRAPRTATVRALGPAHLIKISQASFYQLLGSSPSAAAAVLRVVMDRLRNTESTLMQHEKLAALGTMSAGLAHELNNPAGAVMRGAEMLRDTARSWQSATLGLAYSGLSREGFERVDALRADLERSADALAGHVDQDLLEISDRAGDVEEWLADHEVEEPWEVAPALAALGWDRGRLEEIGSDFTAEQLPSVARWLGASTQALALLNEVSVGASRIAEIVTAVKAYTYLDQAPIQEVDVREGLENTLLILNHKLKGGVTVHRDYAADLPAIEAYAGDLNQVWTNIIDNAIQAMSGRGELEVHAHQDGKERAGVDPTVIVEICDNGPGIPEDVRKRIFEPFYTTKPPGIGTGLGLHLVYNIVVLKHGGQVKVDTAPGHTCFKVILPLRLPRQAAPVNGANGA